MQITRRATTSGAMLLAAIAGSAGAQTIPGFSLQAGFPVTEASSSADGGMFVNVDADPELELVQIAGDHLYVFNLDGTDATGWPQRLTINEGNWGAPAFGDIDGDGEGEIIAHSFWFGLRSDIYAFEVDGTRVPGFPVRVGGGFRSPSLADINADGDLEILFTGNDGGLGTVYAIEGDGSFAPGWPVPFNDNRPDDFDMNITAGMTPAAADLDGDGNVEIVVASWLQLYVFESDGTIASGYPWSPPNNDHAFNSYASPSLADLDDDGELEIVVSTSSKEPDGQPAPEVHVLNLEGTQAAGWPRPLPQPYAGASGIFIPASVADIDGDGSLDIAVGDNALAPDPINTIMAWDRFGNALPGFPTEPVNALLAQITIADIDGDGSVELFFDDNVAGTGQQRIFNHDGTPFGGADLPLGGAFRQLATFDDANGDGFMDIALSGNDQINQRTNFVVFSSDNVPWSPAAAPVATYQYRYTRDGVVPEFDVCDADFDGDGLVDTRDVLAFLNAWGVGDTDADFNDDGTVDSRDVLDFLNAWAAGC